MSRKPVVASVKLKKRKKDPKAPKPNFRMRLVLTGPLCNHRTWVRETVEIK